MLDAWGGGSTSSKSSGWDVTAAFGFVGLADLESMVVDRANGRLVVVVFDVIVSQTLRYTDGFEAGEEYLRPATAANLRSALIGIMFLNCQCGKGRMALPDAN